MEERTYPVLDGIHTTEDLLRLPEEQLPVLAGEIRARIVSVVTENGGHLASSLGAVELIVAMHRVYGAPEDRLVFDVGHQAYAHKILTGRNRDFDTLRREDGISGFPKRKEGDAFASGHASNSISAAVGLARGLKLTGRPGHVIALIGDGALTGGMAYEALNDAGDSGLPLVVLLNDNGMSISGNVGSMRHVLNDLRSSSGYLKFKRGLVRKLDAVGAGGQRISRRMKGFKDRVKRFLMPNLMFEEMGFTYLGPIDGHDTAELIRVLSRAKSMDCPVLVHAVTVKGRGYAPAEKDPESMHGVSPRGAVRNGPTNSEVFGRTMCALAEENPRLTAVVAAMKAGTGLKEFAAGYPERFFDVGIAEPHAVTMAAGMAAAGMQPVVAIYSTFLQRAYDQVLEEVCLQKLPVVFALDRAGLVGEDGETHQGVYDIAYLSHMPGLTLYVPSCREELSDMLRMALDRQEPAAIRYNRGGLASREQREPLRYGAWEVLLPLQEQTVITYGPLVEELRSAAETCGAGFISARFPNLPDEAVLEALRAKARRIIVMEDGIVSLGTELAALLSPVPVICVGATQEAMAQGTVRQQRERCGLTAEHLTGLLTGGLHE